MATSPGAHNAAYIGPGSSTPIGGANAGYKGCELLAVMSQSNTAAQSNLLNIYDGPDVATVQAAITSNASQTTYPLVYRAGLGIGQILSFTFAGRGILMKFGLVAIPAGAANADGGWTIIYD